MKPKASLFIGKIQNKEYFSEIKMLIQDRYAKMALRR